MISRSFKRDDLLCAVSLDAWLLWSQGCHTCKPRASEIKRSSAQL